MQSLLRPAALFVAIGALLYALLAAASEALLWSEGHSHPLYKIASLEERSVDWVVLGASHAMPLDFDDVNAGLERASGQRIVQLAATGAGPLYNRFVLEQFLRRHSARRLLYVVDSFAFASRTWNEERFADAKLLRRMPFDRAAALDLARYVRDEDVDVRALLDYASRFSTINNRERFQPDRWEGEAQFERTARASGVAIDKRIAYLYPEGAGGAARERYLRAFGELLQTARRHGLAVNVVKFPLPPAFARRLPDEAGFDARLAQLLAEQGLVLRDLTAAVPDAAMYFDTDHLNRKGVARLAEQHLVPMLRAP
jgi:hypothetical protein